MQNKKGIEAPSYPAKIGKGINNMEYVFSDIYKLGTKSHKAFLKVYSLSEGF